MRYRCLIFCSIKMLYGFNSSYLILGAELDVYVWLHSNGLLSRLHTVAFSFNMFPHISSYIDNAISL